MTPAIHDISTDLEHPPPFADVLADRRWALNAAEYDGPATAAAQRRAYPEIAPLIVARPPSTVHDAARGLMRAEGWRVVGDHPAEGRLEAVATTSWLRFRDDVVVRLAAVPSGTRVDMRSKSRVGRRDFGANARRVRTFLARLRQSLAVEPT